LELGDVGVWDNLVIKSDFILSTHLLWF
jgi:hypothetical protein